MKCENCTKYDDCRTGSGLTWPCGAYRPKAGSGTDIEKLIERLKYYGTTYAIGDNLGKEIDGSDELMLNAATALSTLQAENEKLRAELERCKEKNAGLALALLTECAPNPDCLGDDEWRAIRAELEKVTRERDAAVERLREWEKFDIYLLAHNFLIPEKWRGIKED